MTRPVGDLTKRSNYNSFPYVLFLSTFIIGSIPEFQIAHLMSRHEPYGETYVVWNNLSCSQLVHHNVMHEEYCRSLDFGLYNSFSQSFPLLNLSLIFWPTQVGWCAALLLRIVVRPLCQIAYWSRHRPVTIDILCSVGTVACARFRCACLPLFGLSITLNLPSWKAVG